MIKLPFNYCEDSAKENAKIYFEEIAPEFPGEYELIKNGLEKYGVDISKCKIITYDDCDDCEDLDDFVLKDSHHVEDLDDEGCMGIYSYNGRYYYAGYEEGLLSIFWEFEGE